jgi:hypothetical protein
MNEQLTYDETANRWRSVKDWAGACQLQSRYIQGLLPFNPTYHGSLSHESQEILPSLRFLNEHLFLTTLSQPAYCERSQNPHFSRDDTKQRAFVTGWAPESVVNRLRLADLASSGLSLCIYCPSGLDSCGWVRCLQCNGCAFDDSQTPLATVFSASDRQRRDDIAASSAPPISLPANAASTRLRCHCPHRPSDCRVFVTCLNAGELPFYLAGGADVLDKQFNGFRAYCSRSFVDGVLAHMSYVTVVDMEWGRKELLWKTLHNALEG